VRQVQSFIPSKRDGSWKWPPTVVVESDDNLFNVSPLNPAFKTLGIRDPSGNDLPPDHHVGLVVDGEKKILYRDGHDGFSLADNRQRISAYRKFLEAADAVQCSTEAVASAIQAEASAKRVRVFPNMVRLDHYEQVDLTESKKIKILWQGGSNHEEDWAPLRGAMGRITKKYPQVEWIIWGALYHWAMADIPAERYVYKKWCPYQEYKLRMAMIGHDINLAPLQESKFNACRSAIKFYESSVLKKPAATLAQRSGAYKHEIRDGETGLLFDGPDDFEARLSELIEDETRRKALAANAKDWVSENRDAMKLVPEMIEWWQFLREERKIEQPRVTDSEWQKIEAEILAADQKEPEAKDGPLQLVQ
jgi:glycosyltransferase involved in cell wall biosynthesis